MIIILTHAPNWSSNEPLLIGCEDISLASGCKRLYARHNHRNQKSSAADESSLWKV